MINVLNAKLRTFLTLLRLLPKLYSRNRVTKDPKRIVIIQLAKLGDMVCTTPMFRAVKEKYPNCRVTVVGDGVNKELLENNEDVDKYLVWDKRNPLALLSEIKEGEFDFGCTTGPSFHALALLLLADVPLISTPKVENGWSPYETRPYKWIRKLVISKPHRMGSYAPREYLRLLEPIDIFSTNTKKHLAYSPEAEKKISKYIEEKGVKNGDFLVGISKLAGNKIKEWPKDRFEELADYLVQKNNAKIFDIAPGIFNLDELKCLISKLKLFIAVDTGPIYIAEAFGVPTVDIIGPMDEREQPPISDIHRVVVPKRKKPELHIMNARVYDTLEARRQVEQITVDMVKREVDDLMGKIKL